MTTVSNVYKAQLLVLVDSLIEYSADRDVVDEEGNYLGRRDGYGYVLNVTSGLNVIVVMKRFMMDEDMHCLTMCMEKLETFPMVHTVFTNIGLTKEW